MDNPLQDLLPALRTEQASSPALIWYGADSERVELSGRVLENWTAKSANLLLEELDAAPGLVLDVALPAHWKAVALVLGSWACGSSVRILPEAAGTAASQAAEDAFATVTADASALAAAAGVPVAVALGALQTRWDGDLPADGIDYAAAVRSFADSFDDYGRPAEDRPALTDADGRLTWTDLGRAAAMQAATPAAEDGRPPVLLAEASLGLRRVLQAALGAWYAGGTLVLAGPGAPLDELSAAERVTARVGA